MTNKTNQPSNNLLMRLRRVLPKRAMTYGESLNVAQIQAMRLRQLLDATSAAMPLEWADELPNVELKVLPAHEIEALANGPASGLTTRQRNGDYLIAINKNASVTHRRFSLAHEIKHLIDYPYAEVLHARLGLGRPELQAKQIEWIADHFAACLLMPSTLVKRAWMHGIQDVAALAGLFRVSEESMTIRLTNMGFLDKDERPARSYFRMVGRLDLEACGV